jgi:hypothetical protein
MSSEVFEFSIFRYAVSFSLPVLVEKCGQYEMFKIICNVVTFVETRRFLENFSKMIIIVEYSDGLRWKFIHVLLEAISERTKSECDCFVNLKINISVSSTFKL